MPATVLEPDTRALAPRFSAAMLERIGSDLLQSGYCHVPGQQIRLDCAIEPASWRQFSDCWGGLTLDNYMGDGGTYRFRRYGAINLDGPDAALTLLPHGPYEQPRYINTLNGGKARHFDPIEERFVEHPFLHCLLRSLASVFDAIHPGQGGWNIRLHPYRIRTWQEQPGLPTPEGLHRDGVDYIVTMMVRRLNVEGATTVVTDNEGVPRFLTTLNEPMELLVADDTSTMHSVSPLQCKDPLQEAYRDVLVVAFTRYSSLEQQS
ncbi:hypothetical protein SAMN02745857_01447 [Andreprevotia lacus DSM 23236]|jgi:hypothetical protein|uniref:2OG-Fe dioxygenase n=1 Tax=Andreprevotia lacus DSM 23236 TaxID=1121001 RepID=A0A1W1XFI9_9NEIS|nr:2OG-Fe dioxygenase family protein [Andreprevotia lacus]SMC22690.1 hypothetical protein SAMN02745857_01447 [Andreprevotia lacus DSM 23236]